MPRRVQERLNPRDTAWIDGWEFRYTLTVNQVFVECKGQVIALKVTNTLLCL